MHGIVYVAESETSQDPLEKEGRIYSALIADSQKKGGISRLTDLSIVKQLSEFLAKVKDEQSYIVLRERTHRNTAESTNARVKWWSIFQLGVLIGEGIFQVWWLKRFFEVCLSCCP